MAASICLRIKGLKTEQAKADAIKVDQSTLHRVLRGATAPGPRFIAGVLLAFPELDFSDLFEVIPDDEQVPA
jgi:hypothetical protein